MLTADWVGGIGVTGTSLNAGYAHAWDDRAAYNWAEMLADRTLYPMETGQPTPPVEGQLDFGPFDPTGGHKNLGHYDFNHALQGGGSGGGGTSQAVADTQAPALAAEIAAGRVNVVVIEANHDFVNSYDTPGAIYAGIYSGALAGSALDQYIDERIANLRRAIDTLQAAGDVKIVAESYLDFGVSPYIRANFPDPVGRARVTAAVAAANLKYRAMTDALGIPMIDLDRFSKYIVDFSNWNVGGVTLDRSAYDPPSPYHLFIDAQHPGTVTQGLIANLFIAAIDGSYGADVAPLTDQEILQNAGITPSGGEATYFDVSQFVRRIDHVAPTSTLTALPEPTGADGTYNGPVTMTVQASDNRFGAGVMSVEYSTDGGHSWIAADGSGDVPGFTFALWTHGTYNVLYRAVDAAGNCEPPHALAEPIRIATALDTTFGNDGKVITDFHGSGIDVPAAVAVQADGKTIVAGTTFWNTRAFALARYNTDGTLDTSFGVQGRAIGAFGLDDEVRDIAIQADGRVVLVGAVDRAFALVRFNANGTLDTAFGDGGLVATTFVVPNPALSDPQLLSSRDFGVATGVVIQPDGRIVAVGQAANAAYFGPSGAVQNQGIQASQLIAARYSADGRLDPSFGQGGKVQLDSFGKVLHYRGSTVPMSRVRFYWHSVGMATGVALAPDGKLVLTGITATFDPSQNPSPTLGSTGATWTASRCIVQLNADGSLDAGFGTRGQVLHASSEGLYYFESVYNFNAIPDYTIPGRAGGRVAVQADGKIVFTDDSGRIVTDDGQFDRHELSRLNADGSVDAGFGSGGTVTTDTPVPLMGSGGWSGLVLQGDRIVVSDLLQLMRFDDNGAPDDTFGAGGVVPLPFNPPDSPSGTGLALSPGGKLVASGVTFSGPDVGTGDYPDFAVARFDDLGNPDSSFGVGGLVVTDISTPHDNWAADLALQPDGKSVQLGTDLWEGSFELARHNADGSLDTSFGIGGRVTTVFGEGFATASSVAVSGGKVLAVGTVYHGDGTSALALVRYNADGSLDTGFDGDGLRTVAVTGYDRASRILVQPDGKIVVVGTAHDGAGAWNKWVLVRLNPNGVLDTSFQGGTASATLPGTSRTDGHFELYAPYADSDAVLQSDGFGGWRIVVAGDSDGDFVLMRFRADGTLDSTFGVGGLVLTDVAGGSDDAARKVALTPGGKIVVGGLAAGALALAQYDADGHLDAGFGGGQGIILTNESYLPRFSGLAIQSDGKIVVTGERPRVEWEENPSHDWAVPVTLIVARFNSDGSVDTGFGTDVDGSGQPTGRVLHDNLLSLQATYFGAPPTLAGLVLQPNGDILVGGSDWQPGGDAFHFLLLRFEGGATVDDPVPIVSQDQVATELTNIVATANSSGQDAEVTLQVTTSDPSQAADQAQYVITALAGLPASTGATTTVTLALAPGVSYPSQTVGLPGGVQLIVTTGSAATLDHWTVNAGLVAIEGDINPVGWTINGGTVTLNGVVLSPGSPALTVHGGHVTLTGITAYGGDAPTILVTGGLLTLRNSTIQESTASNQAAVWVTGGTVDLGTAGDPGGNIINVNGPGELVHNAGGSPIKAVGSTFNNDGAPLTSSSLSGLVFADFNNDGEVGFGEQGIAGVAITLSGADFLGNPVSTTITTDVSGSYVFPNLLPGHYMVTEAQPAGYSQGISSVGTVNGVTTGTVSLDQFDLQLGAGLDALNYNYGERPAATGAIQHGQTAGIGFWNNKNGQALIKALNGGVGHQLGDWLAASFPRMFGAMAGSGDLTGQSNASIAAFFQSRFVLKGPKLDAQVLATALSAYVTNGTLNSTGVGTSQGFIVGGNGLGTATFNVGANGAAFGVANNTIMTVMDLLLAADAQSVNGVLYNGNADKRKKANAVFGDINESGDV